MRVIIGSTAIYNQWPDFPREPKDVDLFSDNPEDSGDVYWHPRLSEWWGGSATEFATLDELYTIKVSHSAWELPNGSWGKHISDAMWLKTKGAELIPELHKLLYSVWEEKHGKKKVDLTQESMDFFADAVRRRYDHDSIHVSVAYGERPLYESVLKDGASVQMDMRKVWELPYETQLQLFREEVYATALERILVPKEYKHSPGAAYAWALRRTITSLTKGRSSLFLIENYDQLYRPDTDYVSRHLSRKHHLIPLEETRG
ncbi:hypothetical protein ACFP2T_35855 [Plantactinospora solaniradicis]|uniref:DUF7275 domain-containing protein n=1 Tax=Plantactinospora solaniradicis TaxID=1723736 RepID=A0ABW1KIJ3_9ACTN